MVAERHLGRLTGSIQQIKTSTLSGKHTVGSGHGGQHIFYSAECIVSENLSAASAPGIKVITLRNGAYLHIYMYLHPPPFILLPSHSFHVCKASVQCHSVHVCKASEMFWSAIHLLLLASLKLHIDPSRAAPDEVSS